MRVRVLPISLLLAGLVGGYALAFDEVRPNSGQYNIYAPLVAYNSIRVPQEEAAQDTSTGTPDATATLATATTTPTATATTTPTATATTTPTATATTTPTNCDPAADLSGELIGDSQGQLVNHSA